VAHKLRGINQVKAKGNRQLGTAPLKKSVSNCLNTNICSYLGDRDRQADRLTDSQKYRERDKNIDKEADRQR
jgi:hypothetical protein